MLLRCPFQQLSYSVPAVGLAGAHGATAGGSLPVAAGLPRPPILHGLEAPSLVSCTEALGGVGIREVETRTNALGLVTTGLQLAIHVWQALPEERRVHIPALWRDTMATRIECVMR